MVEIKADIDDLTHEIMIKMTMVKRELNQLAMSNPEYKDKSNYLYRSINVAFTIGWDHADAAAYSLAHKKILGGAFIRANIENIADIVFIKNNPEFAQDYIEVGMKGFSKGMEAAFAMNEEERLATDAFANVNSWAVRINKNGKKVPVTISEKLKAAAKIYPRLAGAYKYYCYFSHSNPGLMHFVVERNQWQKHGLVTTMVDDNCALALYLMRIAVDNLGIESINIEEIEALERRLGERLV